MANVKNVGEVYRCEVCGNVVEVTKVGAVSWSAAVNR
jgi:desulfoferrodoxin-like iron-binding protein